MKSGKLIIPVKPVINPAIKLFCTRPYYNHPNGCPNYGKKMGCPPDTPMFDEVYDLSKPIYAICNIFDFSGHVEKMREKHPDWSPHQLQCVLYWQGTARKKLKEHITEFLKFHPEYHAETCPEAMGVNISKTMYDVGVKLEWPPVNVAYQIAMAGVKYTR